MNRLQSKNYVEWDVRNWTRALDFWERCSRLDLTDKRVLELGGRNGGLSLWLAEKGARVECADYDGPTDAAVSLHRGASLRHPVVHSRVDATAINSQEAYDLIVFKSVLGSVGKIDGLRSQEKAMAAIFNALKPNGELWFAENLSASPVHKFLRKTFIPWGNDWRYITSKELDSMLDQYDFQTTITLGVTANLGRTEWQRSLLSVADEIVFEPLSPSRWRYIAAGVAMKSKR